MVSINKDLIVKGLTGLVVIKMVSIETMHHVIQVKELKTMKEHLMQMDMTLKALIEMVLTLKVMIVKVMI